MMKTIIFAIKLCIVFSITMQAQTPLQRLESVPEEFIERYQQENHEYNPLHVGNIWQFVNYMGGYSNREIEKDTIVNDITYFKKLESQYVIIPDYYYWERNDTSKLATYRLDIQDLDEDGDSLDEVLLDSLEVPRVTTYLSYRHTWKPWTPDPKMVVVVDSLWIVVFGDTVISRIVSFLFQDELVADKYGVVQIYPEGSPPLLLTGMIINGVTYGNIVNVDKPQLILPTKFKLYNNFPNPFNPITNIKFRTSNFGFVSLKIYDVLGNEIKTLVHEEKPAGEYQVTFDGSNLASGIYVYQLKTEGKINSKKMILLK